MDVWFRTPFGLFVWDSEKAVANWRKHGVSFEEATEVFADRGAVIRYDASHSLLGEDRFRTVGSAAGRRLLLVISTERPGAMRIISARGADRKERLEYESENDGGGMGRI